MDAPKTSISAGMLLRDVLLRNSAISKITKNIFPVVTDNAKLPYILYRHAGLETMPARGINSDKIDIEMLVCTATYSQGIELAELVRSALESQQTTSGNLTMRDATLVGFESSWEADAHVQTMTFAIKIM